MSFHIAPLITQIYVCMFIMLNENLYCSHACLLRADIIFVFSCSCRRLFKRWTWIWFEEDHVAPFRKLFLSEKCRNCYNKRDLLWYVL